MVVRFWGVNIFDVESIDFFLYSFRHVKDLGFNFDDISLLVYIHFHFLFNLSYKISYHYDVNSTVSLCKYLPTSYFVH